MKTNRISQYLLLAACLLIPNLVFTACDDDDDNNGTLTEVNATTNLTADDFLGSWEGLIQDNENFQFSGSTYTYRNAGTSKTGSYSYTPGTGLTIDGETYQATMFFNKRAFIISEAGASYFAFMAKRDGLDVNQNAQGTWRCEGSNYTYVLIIGQRTFERLEIEGTEALRISGTYELDDLELDLDITKIESTSSFNSNTLTASSWEVRSTQRQEAESGLLVHGNTLYCGMDQCIYTKQ